MVGRIMSFCKSEPVRILTIDGKISDEEYMITVDRADRNGYVTLQEIDSPRGVKVNQRRILYNCNEDDVFVVSVGDKFRAVCPNCSFVQEVTVNDDFFICPSHGQHSLKWKEKPMAEAQKVDQTKEETPDKAEKTATSSKEKKTTGEKANKKAEKAKSKKVEPTKEKPKPEKVDLAGLADDDRFELWSKHTKFDHEQLDVQAHILLLEDGENSRKLCFNTYDGTLGKKGGTLPIDEFANNSEPKGKIKWYKIKDVEKAKNNFEKNGYEKR